MAGLGVTQAGTMPTTGWFANTQPKATTTQSTPYWTGQGVGSFGQASNLGGFQSGGWVTSPQQASYLGSVGTPVTGGGANRGAGIIVGGAGGVRPTFGVAGTGAGGTTPGGSYPADPWEGRLRTSLSAIDALMQKYGPNAASSQSSANGMPGMSDMDRILAMQRPEAPSPLPREHLSPTDYEASDAATWARGKDAIARSTTGAMKSLMENQSARGFDQQSGVYAGEEGKLMQTGLGALGDLSRQQAITTTDRDAAARLAEYQGQTQQRGQDTDLLGAGYGGNVTMRGQDVTRMNELDRLKYGQNSQSSSIQSLLPSLMSLIQYSAY